MASRRVRRFRLPGGITITVVRLAGVAAAAAVLQAAAAAADVYMLYGQTFSGPPSSTGTRTPTGPGFYVGISQSLRDSRAADSLEQWVTQRDRLEPAFAVLIRRSRPLPYEIARLVETHLIRQLWLDFTMLNTVSGCPTAARRLDRRQVAYGLWLTGQLLGMVRGRLLPDVKGTPAGGTLHEQIVRLVRARGPMLTTEVVVAAATAGIPLAHHGDPTATVRRDGATRERDSRGPTRIHHTRVLAANGRRTCLFYPPSMSRSQAIATWRRRSCPAPVPPQRRTRRRR